MSRDRTAQEEVLRDLLRGHQVIYPAMVFGMLGGDPNDFTTEEYARIASWLRALGYVRRVRGRFTHPQLMSVWVRDQAWPGDEFGRPYGGIPLRPDPDFREERRQARRHLAARQREFFKRLDELYGAD